MTQSSGQPSGPTLPGCIVASHVTDLLFVDKLIIDAEVVSVGRTFRFTAKSGKVQTI